MHRPYRQHLVQTSFGYITSPEDEAALLKEDRFQMVLVRCTSCRFICAIQDLSTMVEMINKADTTHIRDICVSDRF